MFVKLQCNWFDVVFATPRIRGGYSHRNLRIPGETSKHGVPQLAKNVGSSSATEMLK